MTAPTPATAPLTTRLAVALSTSVSVPGVFWITPLAAVAVSVASSLTAPTSATATGASFTATTVMVATAVFDVKTPSLTVTLMILGVVDGFSDVLENLICSMASAYCAFEKVPVKVTVISPATLVLTLKTMPAGNVPTVS